MAEDLSNTSMATLLTDFTDLFQRIVKVEMPQEDKLEQMADILEGVTDELKTYCSIWKTATQQAEDGARQMAQGNEEIEETKMNMAEKNEELEERRKQMQKQEDELFGRRLELEVKERQFEEKRAELENKEMLLQQQSVDLERTGLTSRIQHARLQSEAALFQSKESKFVQEWNIFQAKVEADKEVDIQRKNWEEGLRKREENLQLTYQSVIALNDTVNKSLAAGRNDHDEDPKARAAASKAKADWQHTLVHHSVSRYDQSRAKRGLCPGSPEKPVSKRRCHTRRSSVGSAGMLTNFGRPEPLPENILDRIAATGHTTISNPEPFSLGTLIQSSQSTVSATAPPGLAEALEEVRDVWRQIEFPIDWDLSASNTLLQGFNKHTAKKLLARSRPAGLLDGSSAQPNCFLCRVSKMKSILDNGDDKSCSNCKPKDWKCVRVSFVTEGLADTEYDANSGEKRWKLTVRVV